jgi:hypothetical protein
MACCWERKLSATLQICVKSPSFSETGFENLRFCLATAPRIRHSLKMKSWCSFFLISFVASSALAGSFFGPGPWANGAYYPGQFDGKYSATVFGNNTSGVLGFALKAGSPTTATNSLVLTNGIQNTIIVDGSQNYWLVFLNGVTYAGETIGSINVSSKQVTGALYNGSGRVNATTFSFASGGFTANLTSDKSPITFIGNNTGQLAVAGGAATTFSLNGIKVSDIATSSFGSQ